MRSHGSVEAREYGIPAVVGGGGLHHAAQKRAARARGWFKRGGDDAGGGGRAGWRSQNGLSSHIGFSGPLTNLLIFVSKGFVHVAAQTPLKFNSQRSSPVTQVQFCTALILYENEPGTERRRMLFNAMD